MRWWLALSAGLLALIVVMLPPHNGKPMRHDQDAVRVVATASPSAPLATPTQQVASSTAAPPAPLPSAPSTPQVADDEPSWIKVNPEMEPRALYARVRREARDREWASQAERDIKSQLAKIPYVGGAENSTVRCASTVCEITGSAPADLPDANLKVAWLALQDAPFRDALRKQGLMSEAAVFGGDKDQATFTLYYTRERAGR